MAIVALVAVLAAGLFTGAALYITFVEHPARLSCGPAVALAEFRPSYARATVMQVSLVVAGAGAGAARWALGGAVAWLLGAVSLAAVVPFTLLIVLPTNHRLLDATLDAASPDTVMLLRRWGWLHALRSVLGLIAFATFVVLLVA